MYICYVSSKKRPSSWDIHTCIVTNWAVEVKMTFQGHFDHLPEKYLSFCHAWNFGFELAKTKCCLTLVRRLTFAATIFSAPVRDKGSLGEPPGSADGNFHGCARAGQALFSNLPHCTFAPCFSLPFALWCLRFTTFDLFALFPFALHGFGVQPPL